MSKNVTNKQNGNKTCNNQESSVFTYNEKKFHLMQKKLTKTECYIDNRYLYFLYVNIPHKTNTYSLSIINTYSKQPKIYTNYKSDKNLHILCERNIIARKTPQTEPLNTSKVNPNLIKPREISTSSNKIENIIIPISVILFLIAAAASVIKYNQVSLVIFS